MPPDSPRHAPLALWRIAREYIVTVFNLFGAPNDIAAAHTLLTEPRKLLLHWLRVGEALLRNLLLIEASALAKPNAPPASSRHRLRKRKLVMFYPEQPQDWRVSFRILDRRRLAGTLRQAQRDAEYDSTGSVSVSLSLSKAKRPGLTRFHDAWPLALRAEALLRVYNNPAPYAARLARRLHATPQRAEALTTLPPNWDRCLADAHDFRSAAIEVLPHFEPG